VRRLGALGITTFAISVWALDARAVDTQTALDALGFPPDAEARVRAGEFLETSLSAGSERDLNIGIAFLIAKPPAEVMRRLHEETVLQEVDPATIAYGPLEGEGTVADLASLELTPAQLKAYGEAGPGDALNLSSEEIAALGAIGKDATALQATVREELLARYRAYRSRGLAGMAPYARRGSRSDPAADLKASNRVVRASKLLPAAFYDLLDSYPVDAPPDLDESFYWSQFTAHGQDTIALVHTMRGTVAGSPISVQRQYYVSTGYNVEQAIAGFQPVPEGTLVIYTNHTSTDQLAGFGSGAKRSIGRKLMAGQLHGLFEKASAEITR
jgi:hypothetical protein